ncbi:hypothetical protein HELRODRAFT_99097 [Helobdella robusta]|uniref:Exportin-2 n=1 Tax=Helobdella robusta TaxID=6412 RepID=T1G9Q9_HELRO|nr:hypothetical protein HELRODRAFT_99097 [Helobdella robusta]ESO05215.1 hypothetical protein HELRODRAFT_99097 [Helobdella robusta]
MDITENNLQQLGAYLQKTLSIDPAERRAAEKFLESIESNQNYPILLLSLVDKTELPIHMRISGSVIFKNYIKRNWSIRDDGSDRIHANDRLVVKQNIIRLMLKAPEQIQKQLSDAISRIGKEDFPDKWPNLMDEMIEKFSTSSDFHVINGVLYTAHSIFKRYRHEFQSNKLWAEIKFVLDKFALPFTQLTNKMMELAQMHASSPDNLRLIYSSIILICKIFYSLNFQDLPEFFEDNMQTWMNHFHVLLNADCKLLETDDKDEPGVMEQVKTQVCDNLAMYAQKYDEEFGTYLPLFVTDVWHLLINTGVSVKYDLLVSNAIQFLASVADRPGYKSLFEDPNTLASICEKIIVPNMVFREADEEAFEDNAEEYIRRDIEGSDVDTRRRAACDLVRALSKSFEDTVIKNFSIYIQNMLQAYRENPQKNWKSKDAAIFLVTSLAAKAQTQKHGITQTSSLVNVTEFFTNHIAPDLNSNANENPVIKADAIKYIMVFRNQLSRDILVSCLAPLVSLLLSGSHVVHSYSACCLDKMLSMKPAIITRAELAPHGDLLLQNLFTAMNVVGSQENEYIMRGIMKSLHILQDAFVPHVSTIMGQLLSKLDAVSKNPSKPHFNHCLFESLCIVISVVCRLNPGPEVINSFESPLFPLFQNILQQDVQEFVPYIFQVLSLMLEMHKNSIPVPYMSLFPILMQPLLWERSGNVPALVRLLQAYIVIGCHNNQIPADKLPGLLGIFQKLLASRSNDHFGMQLLNTMLVHVPHNDMEKYIHQVFLLLFQKLTSSKTTKYVKCVLVFFSLFIVKFSAAVFIEMVDKIQAKMFTMVLEKLYIAETAKITNALDRKLCAVAMTNILCEPTFLKDDSHPWLPLLKSLLETLESAVAATSFAVEESPSITESAELEGFQAAYSQLLYSGKQEVDYCIDVSDPKIYLAKKLHVLCHSTQKVKATLQGLPPQAQNYLSAYFTAAGVSIA